MTTTAFSMAIDGEFPSQQTSTASQVNDGMGIKLCGVMDVKIGVG
jgi:hypothetical protein